MKNFKIKFASVTRVFLMIAFLGIASCSKDEDPAPVVTSTFTNALNGTYSGNGTDSNNVPFSGDVTLNVTGGTTANISGDAGSFSITDVAVSSGGGYTGKTNSGASISLSFSEEGNKKINIGGPITFNGVKP